MNPSRRLLAVWLLALCLPAVIPALLTGCQPVKPVAPPVVSTTGCTAFSLIVLTEAEAQAAPLSLLVKIRAHNNAFKALCVKK